MFTFKTVKPTGRYGAFALPTHYIKHNKIVVGEIDAVGPYKIHFMIIKDDINSDGNPNCAWRWFTVKNGFISVDAAKLFLKYKYDVIIEQLNLVKE